MSKARDTKGPNDTICRRCSGSASARTTRREFLLGCGAAAASVAAGGPVRPAWAEEPKSLLAPTTMPVRRPTLRVVLLGRDAAAAEAASLTKALADTAGKLSIGLDLGPQKAGSPDGLLVVALNGRKDQAMAEAAKRGAAPAVVLCPKGQAPASGAVWQLGESKAGLLVGTSRKQ